MEGAMSGTVGGMLLAAATDATKVVFDLPPEAIAAAGLLVGVSFLVSIAAGIATVWNVFAKRPPTSETLHEFRKHVAETYCTKEDLRACITQCSASNNRSETATKTELEHMRADMKDIRSLFEQGIKELQRALGRVEGKLEK
jgi:GTP1/Obg family GTP-binding protein